MRTTADISTSSLVPVDFDQPVHDADGEELGTIDRIVVDIDRNRIAYATLNLNGGFDGDIAVPWPELRRDRAGVFHLNLDRETLRAGPRPEPVSESGNRDRWLRELYLYYGHVPYDTRAMR